MSKRCGFVERDRQQQTTHERMKLTAAKAGENRIIKSPSPVAAFCCEEEKADDESDHDNQGKGKIWGGDSEANKPAAPPTALSQ